MPKHHAGSIASGRSVNLQLEILEDRRLLSGLTSGGNPVVGNQVKPVVAVLLFESAAAVESSLGHHAAANQASSLSLPKLQQDTASLAVGGDQANLPNGLWQSLNLVNSPVAKETSSTQISAIALNGHNLPTSEVHVLSQATQQILQVAGKNNPPQASEEKIENVVQQAQHHLSGDGFLSSVVMEKLHIVMHKAASAKNDKSSSDVGVDVPADSPTDSGAVGRERLAASEKDGVALGEVAVAAEDLLLTEAADVQEADARTQSATIAEATRAERTPAPERTPAAGRAQSSNLEGAIGTEKDRQPVKPAGRVDGNLPAEAKKTPAPITRTPSSEEETGLEQAGELAAFTPELTGALDRALRQFLDEIDDLGEELGQMISDPELASWIMLMAVAGTAAEVARRQLRRRSRMRQGLVASAGAERLSWSIGLPGAFDTDAC
jgi:hypothetical protein